MAEEKIVYLPIDTPMEELEMASALNVPFDDPHRRAVMQILDEEIEIAASLMQGKSVNHGMLGEHTGSFLALRSLKAVLNEKYKLASDKLKVSAKTKETAVSSSY